MSKPEHFFLGGREIDPVPYHYRECGLDNIYLLNGFTRDEYDGEEYISVHNVDGLWKAISLNLVVRQKTLSPKEIRFLRGQMDLTQAELASKLRVDDQTVARWEKGKSKLPGPADVALRTTFLASPIAQPEGYELLKHWPDMVTDLVSKDQMEDDCFIFEREDEEWTEREPMLRFG